MKLRSCLIDRGIAGGNGAFGVNDVTGAEVATRPLLD